mmetsp:Transcript_24321/g.61881  ORF Transcript_24321/g.61881 Transcript_24321/m.61881 type:complete len:276 (-) Transcript_24321:999-1826(-)
MKAVTPPNTMMAAAPTSITAGVNTLEWGVSSVTMMPVRPARGGGVAAPAGCCCCVVLLPPLGAWASALGAGDALLGLPVLEAGGGGLAAGLAAGGGGEAFAASGLPELGLSVMVAGVVFGEGGLEAGAVVGVVVVGVVVGVVPGCLGCPKGMFRQLSTGRKPARWLRRSYCRITSRTVMPPMREPDPPLSNMPRQYDPPPSTNKYCRGRSLSTAPPPKAISTSGNTVCSRFTSSGAPFQQMSLYWGSAPGLLCKPLDFAALSTRSENELKAAVGR